jgi:hypothetical protein
MIKEPDKVEINIDNIRHIISMFLMGHKKYPKKTDLICDGDRKTYCKISTVYSLRKKLLGFMRLSKEKELIELCKILEKIWKMSDIYSKAKKKALFQHGLDVELFILKLK